MNFIEGDYVSCVWIYESHSAIWTILVAKRVLTDAWEISLTWDNIDPETNSARSGEPVHTVKLPGNVPEDEVLSTVEDNIKLFEISGLSKKIALLEVHSSDPAVMIKMFESLAMRDERFGCSIIVREIPELEEE